MIIIIVMYCVYGYERLWVLIKYRLHRELESRTILFVKVTRWGHLYRYWLFGTTRICKQSGIIVEPLSDIRILLYLTRLLDVKTTFKETSGRLHMILIDNPISKFWMKRILLIPIKTTVQRKLSPSITYCFCSSWGFVAPQKKIKTIICVFFFFKK